MGRAGCIVLCGVAGCGKSAVGRELAERGCLRFVEADDLHPASNVRKMRSGEPLTDDDRLDWLLKIHEIVNDGFKSKESLVVACSALKKMHRDLIVHGASAAANDQLQKYVRFVLLDIDRPMAKQRVKKRTFHFFPASLVDSQFDALEISPDLIIMPGDRGIAVLVAEIIDSNL